MAFALLAHIRTLMSANTRALCAGKASWSVLISNRFILSLFPDSSRVAFDISIKLYISIIARIILLKSECQVKKRYLAQRLDHQSICQIKSPKIDISLKAHFTPPDETTGDTTSIV